MGPAAPDAAERRGRLLPDDAVLSRARAEEPAALSGRPVTRVHQEPLSREYDGVRGRRRGRGRVCILSFVE